MDRRAFLGTLGLLAAPRAAGAQPAMKVYRVGILGNENNPPWDGFRQGLRDLGYVDGRNLSMEWRWSEGKPDRFPALAMELVALRPDVIVASGTQAVRAAMKATSAIPIVMTTSSYPDKIGLVKSPSRPGGNVTGLSNVGPELSGKKLELLKEIAPKVSRVAVLWNPASTVEPLALQELLTAAPAVSVEIQSVEVRSPDDFSAAFAAVASSRVHALLALGNPINFKGRQLIVDFAVRNRLPSIYDERLFVDAGGLMSYAPNFTDSFRRAPNSIPRVARRRILGGAGGSGNSSVGRLARQVHRDERALDPVGALHASRSDEENKPHLEPAPRLHGVLPPGGADARPPDAEWDGPLTQ